MQDVKELLRQVRRIEIRSRQAMSELTAGAYRSRFKGQGMVFEEVREYVPGDDVRHIDWNVTARAGHAYVKVFREERELTVMLLVDCSASMRFGAIPGISPRSKMLAAAEAAAVVAVTALANKDRIGLLAFSDHTEEHLTPRRGRNHVMRLVRSILDPDRPARPTRLVAALQELQRTNRKQTVCFLISDFLDEEPGFATQLQQASRRHDLIGLRIADPAERSLPDGPWPLPLQDPETGRSHILAGGRQARRAYEAAWQQHRAATERSFRAAGCDLLDIETPDSAMSAIQRFFARRRRRIGA